MVHQLMPGYSPVRSTRQGASLAILPLKLFNIWQVTTFSHTQIFILFSFNQCPSDVVILSLGQCPRKDNTASFF